ncbi:MAG: hypothetical protein ABI923_03410 [bacterium]
MSKASIGDHFLDDMTEGQEVDAVSEGPAISNLSEGLPDGLENLRSAYQEFWTETHPPAQAATSNDPASENVIESVEAGTESQPKSAEVHKDRAAQSKIAVLKRRRKTKPKIRSSSRPARHRFGLPEGFVPRMQRFGRGVLLELNVYRLPNGQEFIPCFPTGPLGSRHLYALLTAEQYLGGNRGSVYVRSDGRIFDYSLVSANPLGDMFDTGYTIYNLERTGRYAPSPEKPVRSRQKQHLVKAKRKKKSKQTKQRLAAAAR